MQHIAKSRRCQSERDLCRVVIVSPNEAVLINAVCDTCASSAWIFRLEGDRWVEQIGAEPSFEPASGQPTAAASDGTVEIRTVQKRQVHVDGKPVGLIFD
jgi:hypothetical protein